MIFSNSHSCVLGLLYDLFELCVYIRLLRVSYRGLLYLSITILLTKSRLFHSLFSFYATLYSFLQTLLNPDTPPRPQQSNPYNYVVIIIQPVRQSLHIAYAQPNILTSNFKDE